MRLLAVWLGSDEDVDTELGRLVHDLVAALGSEALDYLSGVEAAHEPTLSSPALCAPRLGSICDSHPRVDSEAAGWQCEHRIEIELRHLR